MLTTYIKLAFRGLLKNKVFSFINVFGLAIGLTCCLLITMYIYQELRYDSHQKHAKRLYQVATVSIQDGKGDKYATTTAPMVAVMQADFPEVERTTRLLNAFEDDKTLLQYKVNDDLRSFYESKVYFADSNFFELFTYSFIEGNPVNALSDPNSVVISSEVAEKIFGNEPALNKIIHINSNTNGAFDYRITGVFKPSKTPSHIDARILMSMQGGEVGQWVRSLTGMTNNNMFYSYLLLKPETDPKKLEQQFPQFINRYAGEDLKASGRDRMLYLIPVEKIHLESNIEASVTPPGSAGYLYILASIAIVTLLIACVNFMNLSTARSARRAIEIGVRKVLGAERQSLIRQFLIEAILLSLVAFLISLGLMYLFIPIFETVASIEFTFSGNQYFYFFLVYLGISVMSGLLAGIYPAFYLSAFKPVKVLKGKFSNSLAAISFRRVLVVFQFVISVSLIVASIAIGSQMSYLRSKDLGFVKDQQVIIPLRTSTSKEIYSSLKSTLASNSSITNIGASIYYPGIANVTDWLLYKQGTPAEHTKTVYINRVDESFLNTLGIKTTAGRLFSREFPGDTSNRIILNEHAVREFGFSSPEEAVGKNIAANWGEEVLFNIVGVVKDFHFKDLHSTIESYGFLLNRYRNYNYLVVHARGNNISGTLKDVQAAWEKLNPNEPFEYSFLDQDFQKNYLAENRLADLIRYFTYIAIFISCLGLFGLSTFSVEQRTREIGIRKVLGASVPGIVGLLSKDFIKLVIISFFIASPIAWYFVNQWLQGFAYRVPFSLWILLLSWLFALTIAFLTISIQALRVAVSNPVKSMRIE